jgi:ABC-type glycerol-3-phosphate transport system substrate-binding protein
MKRLILLFTLVLVVVLAACGGTSSPEQAVEEGDGPIVTVYRAPT